MAKTKLEIKEYSLENGKKDLSEVKRPLVKKIVQEEEEKLDRQVE